MQDARNRVICAYARDGNTTVIRRPESAFGADLAARRPANPITLCDDHGIDFVTVAGHIPMAVHSTLLVSNSSCRLPTMDALLSGSSASAMAELDRLMAAFGAAQLNSTTREARSGQRRNDVYHVDIAGDH
jgi:hypothetical protein